MLYVCINFRCKHLFNGDDAKYCPMCGWLVAPEGMIEPETVLKTNSRCAHASVCQTRGEHYHIDCEAGANKRCHNLINSLLAQIRSNREWKMKLLGEEE